MYPVECHAIMESRSMKTQAYQPITFISLIFWNLANARDILFYSSTPMLKKQNLPITTKVLRYIVQDGMILLDTGIKT